MGARFRKTKTKDITLTNQNSEIAQRINQNSK